MASLRWVVGALEDRLNPEPRDDSRLVKVEKHRAGEKCRHWTRGPNGEVAYEPFANLCILCYGTGKLVVDVNLRFHKKKGVLHTFYPSDLPMVDYMPSSARKPYEDTARPRTVA